MSHSSQQFHFPNFFDINHHPNFHPIKIRQTTEITFDETSHNTANVSGIIHNDQRTEDQVRSDLNFSIEDLLNKISKATADFEQQPKLLSQNHKQQPLNNSFKISNLSASTETNSNQQQSDRILEKHQPFVQVSKKRQSQPQKDAFSYNERFISTNTQKQNSVNQAFGEGRNQRKPETYLQEGSNWNAIMKSDPRIGGIKAPEVNDKGSTQWGRDSSRNQCFLDNSSNLKVQLSNEWGRYSSRNQVNYRLEQPQYSSELQRNSSKNPFKTELTDEVYQNEPVVQWVRNSSRNQFREQPINQWISKTPKYNLPNQPFNEWKIQCVSNKFQKNSAKKIKNEVNNQLKTQQFFIQNTNISTNNQITYPPIDRYKSSQKIGQSNFNSSRNQLKLNQVSNFNNIVQSIKLSSQKIDHTQINTKKQLYNPFEMPSYTRIVSKQQLCNPFQMTLKLSPIKKQSTKPQPVRSSSQQILQSQSSKRHIKTLLSPFQNSSFGKNPFQIHNKQQKSRQIAASIIINDSPPRQQQYRQLPIQQGQKVNSLFDTKKIRQVAASRIMESPDKIKNNQNIKNPFMEIIQTTSPDTMKQQKFILSIQQTSSIKMTHAQKSEINPLQPGPKFTIRDFHLGKQLGSGKFGDVYQAVHKATGSLYAIKKIFKSTIIEYNMIEQFTRQLKIHYTLNYPNIIKLYTHFDDEYHIFLVMEYGQGGMLMEKVKNGEKFASVIVEQMLRAVDFLQNKKIAHRDIKPENIVLMFGDTAKMCDFGWSRVFDSDMKKTFCGTLDYVSPQMKDKGQYSLKIDIWSLGVLTFELLCGYAPFKDQITNWKRRGGNMNSTWNWNILYPPEVSSVAESFMRNLLKQNPNERANIRFCLNHLFIRKYNQINYDEEEDKRFRQIAYLLRDQN